MVKSCQLRVTGTNMARILFVDDDPQLLDIYADIFGYYGHEVFIVSTAEKAIQTILTVIPDILVLDINLPDMHGFDLLQRLRKNKTTAKIPAIIVSASPDEIADRAIQVGAQQFLSKPVDPDELLAIIKQYTPKDV
jgi:DNA-binding response OmpR family regulator